jgi:phosphopantothenoylcysteine decarboxylase/phosphopantothenate--cysteine ligase
MGYSIAKMAMLRGADVTLVSGPVNIPAPPFVKVIPVESAKEMFEAVRDEAEHQDIIIKSAAVADYRPMTIAEDKIKKTDGDMSIPLERTTDIIKYLGEHKKEGQFICGFSMETKDMLENSSAKLVKKNMDMIVANNVKDEGAGFAVDTNKVVMITRDGMKDLPLMSKEEVADHLLTEIMGRL